jgi:hypothetical protein
MCSIFFLKKFLYVYMYIYKYMHTHYTHTHTHTHTHMGDHSMHSEVGEQPVEVGSLLPYSTMGAKLRLIGFAEAPLPAEPLFQLSILLFKIDFIYFLVCVCVCVCVCVSLYVCVHTCVWVPSQSGRGHQSPGFSSEQPNVDAGNWTQVL